MIFTIYTHLDNVNKDDTFVNMNSDSGKGGHRNFLHEKGIALTNSGQLGDDAKPS